MQKGDLKSLREILKLNERNIHLISSLKSRKREFSEAFMVSGEDRVYPSEKEYWVATSDLRIMRNLRRIMRNWSRNLLVECPQPQILLTRTFYLQEKEFFLIEALF